MYYNIRLFIFFIFFAIDVFAISIDSALEEIVSSHPEITSILYTWKSKNAGAEHSGVYPDPKLGFAFKNYPYNRSLHRDTANPRTPGMAGVEYTISQEIPFPGKLNIQKKIARLGASEFKLYMRNEKNSLAYAFLSRLVQLHNFDKKIEQLEMVVSLLDSQEKFAKPAYLFGSKTLGNLLNYRITATKTKDRVIELKSKREEIQKELQYYSEQSFSSTDIDRYMETIVSKIEKVSELDLLRASEQNPEYLLAIVKMEKTAKEKTLGYITHLPDMEMFFSYMKRNNRKFMIDEGPLDYKIMDTTEYAGDLFSLGVTVRVPFWSLLQQNHLNEQNDFSEKAAASEKEKRKRLLEKEISKMLAVFSRDKERLELITNRLVPELKQAVVSATSSYQSGKMEASEILNLKTELKMAEISRLEFEEERQLLALLLLTTIDSLLSPEVSQ